MAPASKKRGAPASTQRERQKKLRQEKKERNSKQYRSARAALKDVRLGEPAKSGWDSSKRRPYATELSSEELAKFEELVALGVPIKKIAKEHQDLPTEFVLWRAIADTRTPLSSAYARGKKIAVSRYEEEIEEIARTPLLGTVRTLGQRVTKDGGVIDVVEEREADMLEHRRLLIDTHKWTLAHIMPKKHGRQADPAAGQPNEQLAALFDSLKSGPVE